MTSSLTGRVCAGTRSCWAWSLTVGPGNLWPLDCNISADDPRHRRLGLAWHKKIVEQAAELGAAAYCGALFGHPGHVCRRRPPSEEKIGPIEILNPTVEDDRRRLIEAIVAADELATALPSVEFFTRGGEASVAGLLAEGLRRADDRRCSASSVMTPDILPMTVLRN